MGYTHYFPRIKNVPIRKKDWDGLRMDVQKLYAALPVEIKVVDRDEKPGVSTTSRMIFFNGMAPDDFETFVLVRNPKPNSWAPADDPEIFDCCKTGSRPYDLLVVATLLAAKDRLKGAIRVSSDGAVQDWEDGFRFAVKALQRDMPLREVDDFAQEHSLPYLEDLEKEVNIFAAIEEERQRLEQVLPEVVSKDGDKIKIRM